MDIFGKSSNKFSKFSKFHFFSFFSKFSIFSKKNDFQKSHLDDEEIFEKNVEDFFDLWNTSDIHVCKAVFNNIEYLIY